MPIYKCGLVALIGRSNVGKSTLLNELLGKKISITSHKPQTTRQNLLGIHTEHNSQIVFVDTPGIHYAISKRLNSLMNLEAKKVLSEVDIIMHIFDINRFTKQDEKLLTLLDEFLQPKILVLNKIDKLARKEQILHFIDKHLSDYKNAVLVPISAYKQINFTALKKEIVSLLPQAKKLYPEEMITDRSRSFLAKEIIREKIIRNLQAELPYETAVTIDDIKFDNSAKQWIVRSTIYVDSRGQKSIVIGRQGKIIKKIGSEARKELIMLFDKQRVHLDLWVKVKANWFKNINHINDLVFKEN